MEKTAVIRTIIVGSKNLPSHYVYAACQDASTRAKSFLKLKKRGLTNSEYPEVKNISIWLDDHLWELYGYTSVRISTHRGWINVNINRINNCRKYLNSGWRLRSEYRVKLYRERGGSYSTLYS
ncbi:MAG: hypothetical protein QXE41_03190 [Acidilobaceae archaeon]